MNTPVEESVFHQMLRYQSALQASFMVITNGNETRGWTVKENEILSLDALPDYL